MGEYDVSLYAHYKLSLTGKAPKISTRNGWAELAARVLQGDLAAANGGHPGLTDRHLLDVAYETALMTLRDLDTARAVRGRRSDQGCCGGRWFGTAPKIGATGDAIDANVTISVSFTLSSHFRDAPPAMVIPNAIHSAQRSLREQANVYLRMDNRKG